VSLWLSEMRDTATTEDTENTEVAQRNQIILQC
jgi:hypothetical protein